MKGRNSLFRNLFVASLLLTTAMQSCSQQAEEKPLPGRLNDVTLCYYGGGQRRNAWNREQCAANVSYRDSTGGAHWLFDTFLFLEFYDASDDRHFEMARLLHSGESRDDHGARQQEWQGWLDKTLGPGMPAHLLDEAVGEAAAELGQPKYRREICLMIPIPIIGQTNWGSVEGRPLDFNDEEDRFTACKWYIDRALEMFEAEHFENVGFGGFYWIEEIMYSGRELLPKLNAYLREKQVPMLWIPYYGDEEWSVEKHRELGFESENVFLQPSYAFRLDRDYASLKDICDYARRFDVSMELEFGEAEMRCCSGFDERYAGRLSDYIRAYREHGILDRRLAYYQSGDGLRMLKESTDSRDRALFYELAGYISERQRYLGEK